MLGTGTDHTFPPFSLFQTLWKILFLITDNYRGHNVDKVSCARTAPFPLFGYRVSLPMVSGWSKRQKMSTLASSCRSTPVNTKDNLHTPQRQVSTFCVVGTLSSNSLCQNSRVHNRTDVNGRATTTWIFKARECSSNNLISVTEQICLHLAHSP